MKKISLIAIFVFLFFIAVSLASAQTEPVYSPLVKIPGIDPGANLTQYLSGIFNFVIAITGILAMAMIIYGGMRYLTSVGNPTIAEDGKDAILSAIYGLILALSAWVIIYVVNPDILILKKPGVNIPTGAYNPYNSNSCTVAPGAGTQDSPCKCLDFDSQKNAPLVYGTGDCNSICSDAGKASDSKYHCIKADLRIGRGLYTSCGKVFGKTAVVGMCESLSWDPTRSISKNPIKNYDIMFNGTANLVSYDIVSNPLEKPCDGFTIENSFTFGFQSFNWNLHKGENLIHLRVTDIEGNIAIDEVPTFTIDGGNTTCL